MSYKDFCIDEIINLLIKYSIFITVDPVKNRDDILQGIFDEIRDFKEKGLLNFISGIQVVSQYSGNENNLCEYISLDKDYNFSDEFAKCYETIHIEEIFDKLLSNI